MLVYYYFSYLWFVFQGKPVSALTWGHNNKRLFVAVGCHIYTAWVTKKVALLQYLCRRAIQHRLKYDTMAAKLPLPTKLRGSITALFSHTIKVRPTLGRVVQIVSDIFRQ